MAQEAQDYDLQRVIRTMEAQVTRLQKDYDSYVTTLTGGRGSAAECKQNTKVRHTQEDKKIKDIGFISISCVSYFRVSFH